MSNLNYHSNRSNKFHAKRLATNGVLTAMFFALTMFAVEIAGIKITFDSLPVVLSAMLFALEHPGQGVLETKNGVTQRRPARPIPTRDLWFERVWKADLARREESCK